MFSVGIWARDEELYKILSSKTAQAELRRGRHPAEFTGRKLDLLVAAPDAVGWAGAGAVDCSTVLIHGAAGPLARSLRTGCAVSYGTSPKDTLTFSSLEGDQICLALQRELVTLAGDIVERQELVLPFPVGRTRCSSCLSQGRFCCWACQPRRWTCGKTPPRPLMCAHRKVI